MTLSSDMAKASELEFDLKKVVAGEVRFDAYSRILSTPPMPVSTRLNPLA